MLAEFRAAAASIVRGGSPEIDPQLLPFVQAVIDLDAALEMGFTVTLAEVSPLEFRALAILRNERVRAEEVRQQMAEASAKASQMAAKF